MPLLRQREQALRHELNALVEQTRDRAAHLRLAETLSAFLTRLRSAAETLDVLERQRIVRLLVKEVLGSDDTIVIRHCIPVPSGPSPTASGPNGHAGAPLRLAIGTLGEGGWQQAGRLTPPRRFHPCDRHVGRRRMATGQCRGWPRSRPRRCS